MSLGYELVEEDFQVNSNYEDADYYWGDAWWDRNEDFVREEYEREN